MTSAIEPKLAEFDVTLPDVGHAPKAAGNYLPFVVVGDMVYVSGQISQNADGLITGKLGADMSIEDGALAAKACAVSLLTQLKVAVDGDLTRLVRIVKLTGFVNSTPDFTDQPKVINGASDLFVGAFGDAGQHARAAVSAASLPLGVAVEIEAIFQIK
jgi:enamine deaminase RidA (YjgF/YER057c/UK114 family)